MRFLLGGVLLAAVGVGMFMVAAYEGTEDGVPRYRITNDTDPLGAIVGFVHDELGTAVPNAEIAVTGTNGETVVLEHADDRGGFRVDDLPFGRYSLVISAPGFSKIEVPQVETGDWRFVELTADAR